MKNTAVLDLENSNVHTSRPRSQALDIELKADLELARSAISKLRVSSVQLGRCV